MSSSVLISICIPAYKNIDFLQRLLDSILIQTFADFEVIVTDDSPDEAVRTVCETWQDRLPLHYFRNSPALGTPENWNEGVRKASGKWIKIMHDDDWFAGPESLAEYARAIGANPEAAFIFSAYRDVFLDENRTREMYVPAARYTKFLRNHSVLFASNIIGPPSVVLYKKMDGMPFDRTVKWVVDIDFYIRYLTTTRPAYIDKILVNVGLGKEQVTQDCVGQRKVQIPENFYLLNKVGFRQLRDILVYDAWWRMMRNLEVRKKEDITEAGYNGAIPSAILSMVSWQRLLPFSVWKIGPVSKLGMFLNYLINYNKIPA